MTKSQEKNAQSIGGTLIDDKIGKLVFRRCNPPNIQWSTGIVVSRDENNWLGEVRYQVISLYRQSFYLFLDPSIVVEETPHYIIWK